MKSHVFSTYDKLADKKERIQSLKAKLSVAEEALLFYSDSKNYYSINDKPPEIHRDWGNKAATAIITIRGEEAVSVKCKDCGEEFYIAPEHACPECGCTEFKNLAAIHGED